MQPKNYNWLLIIVVVLASIIIICLALVFFAIYLSYLLIDLLITIINPLGYVKEAYKYKIAINRRVRFIPRVFSNDVRL